MKRAAKRASRRAAGKARKKAARRRSNQRATRNAARTGQRWGDATEAIQRGEVKHGRGGPVAPEIVRSSTFTFSSTAEMKRWAEGKSSAYIYTRYGNPTLAVAEAKIAALEGAEAAIVAASGMAAISSALLAVLSSGDEVISTAQLYGGTYRLMRDLFPRFGIRVRHVEADLASVEDLVTPRARVLYVETPTNPSLRLVDLQRAIAIAREFNLVSIVDNTFASPVLQKPLALGFDMVVHSATKYLGGHSDLVAGAVAGPQAWISRVRDNIIYLGGCMDPAGAYLLIRGMKTLSVRIERQCKSAMAVAKFLERHPKVARVHYPGLASHPDHKLARRQMRDFGGMLSFDLKGGLAAARRFCDRVQLFALAASLGGVESLVILPIYTSHYNMSRDELERAGVEPGTVRVSIGLEDPADLIEDLRQALA
ncbi:MAG TPA: aminotransferase class I/II-fold pyridoxal phosphate-dependent enzyme [Candidatus Acidoferrales bacterium]|nr:aminotransferase class I/II-fold pyridoxal phosphate-dependent enzyme [Candidatus Acidoferrales bacterium]